MNRINEILNNDGVIAFVTDTVWGIGCLPSSKKAVERIYEIKKREAKKPLILMSYDTYPLFDYIKQPVKKQAQRLIKDYFPGALTLVVEKSESTPDYITSGMNTVGIRVPNNETFAKICQSIDGRVLATTSANLSGEALREAISESIRAKKDNLVGNMASQGTTPRQLTDLIGSLCDLTSGSGDKGTPVVLVQGYFDNYTN